MAGLGNRVQIEAYQPNTAKPNFPVKFEDWERLAFEKLASGPYHYIADGAGGGDTMRENKEAFMHWRILPRMLNNVEERSTSITLLGQKLPSPILMAPVGVQSIAHPEGELAAARGARVTGLPYIASTAASHTMEEISAELGNTPKWFQLYWGKDPDVTASMLKRAERSGYSALVVTLDTSMLSWREKDIENAYLPFLKAEGMANYLSDPAFLAGLKRSPKEDLGAAVQHFVELFSNAQLTWEDLKFIRETTTLPILLKGILHPEDAQKALDFGVDGIIVSNHGGRQVDGAIASLDALPRINDVVKGEIPILLDSGIRRGSDIMKAIALGASAVLIGRPYVYGLAVGGAEGVQYVLRNLMADFDLTMALSGKKSIFEIDQSLLVKN